MDPDSTQGTTIKRACIVCGREYGGDVTICPEDNTPLTALKQDTDVGTIIGDRYEILGILGKGGMGRVYKARHRLMKRIVAIKMLYPNLVSTASTLKRFQQEAQATSTLSHPNILTVHDFGLTDDGQPYLVMDFLEGTSLGEVLQEIGNLELDRFLRIFIQSASALQHAHQKGVIHRDIKPSNIMLVSMDENPDFVKIVDFGIAKMMSADPTEAEPLTRTGEVFGSPMYMSPEQCRGQQLDLRTDIYSLGCVMYRSITGLSPFMGHDQLECMFKQVNEEPERFSEVCPDLFLPDELETIIFKALAKKPEERYESMSELRQALEAMSPEYRGRYLTTTQIAAPGAPGDQPSGQTTAVAAQMHKQGETTLKDAAAVVESSQSIPTTVSPPVPESILPPELMQKIAPLLQRIAPLLQKIDPFLKNKMAVRIAVGSALGILGAIIAVSLTHKNPEPTPVQPAVQPPPPGIETKVKPSTAAESPDEQAYDQQMTVAQQALYKGNYDEAERQGIHAMNLAKALPEGDKQYAASLNFLGYVNYVQGQYDESATYLQKALRIRQSLYGDKSAEVAETKTLLGRAWSALGQLSKAQIVLDQALATRQALFGPNDLSDADTLSAQADVDIRKKKYSAAAEKLARALEIREITQGKEHPDVATAMNDLAQAYELEGNGGKALSLYTEALKIRQSKLSPDNPLIADSYVCIGTICAQNGQIDQAKKLYESALAIQEKSLAPTSPRITSTRKRLADLNKAASRKAPKHGKSFNDLLAR